MRPIREQLARARTRLAKAGIASPGREAALLLGSILRKSETALLAGDEAPLPEGARARFERLVERRAAGEPMAYLLGSREFFGRRFRVDSRVLIPRPETELLVELALALPLPVRACVLDIGVGSGAIALTLAAERPGWSVVGGDLSLGALAAARANRRAVAPDGRVLLAASDAASAFRAAAFDLVVANPPYVDPADPALVEAAVRAHEPHLALFADDAGLAMIRRLLAAGPELAPGAWLVFEIGFGQAETVARECRTSSALELVEIRSDAAGIPRVVVCRARS